jgi:hypothetical protein
MSNKQRHLKDADVRKQIARAVKRRLALLIGFLIVVLLALLFRAGEAWWPVWLMEHRTQTEGIVILAVSLLVLASPILVEASSNPRVLSGPGKNPEGPRLDE